MTHVLTLSCPDRPGIVAAVSAALAEAGGNITASQQFGSDTGTFFMRVEVELEGDAPRGVRERLGGVGESYAMSWDLVEAAARPRVLVMVSSYGHCLNDLLFRASTGALPIEVVGVVSNHETFAGMAANHDVPFHHVPVTRGTKPEAEARLKQIAADSGTDLLVLARYMQILSDDLCRHFAGRAINIHHSMLPSFKGAKPYHQAHARGVKLVGATAHYVTADLDEGPIIEQEVARVDHSKDVEELVAIGRDTECQALARAVRWHAERRVLLDGSRTVVFR
ncbi:formyltetrahydrofolate deformylase [Nocardioidaceae bacterium]|nr:formyltetrahydrofolate deformylase [Nocardioidaceae bacterium]